MITPPRTPPIPPAPSSFDALLPRSSSIPGTKPIPAEFGHCNKYKLSSPLLFMTFSCSSHQILQRIPCSSKQPLLSLSTICRLSRFFAALLPRLQFFVARARARARGGFPTLCVLRSRVPRPTRCEKGKPLNLCTNDTRLSTGVKTKHVSTCMKRTKVLRVFKRHVSQPV